MLKHILVTLDGSQLAEEALGYAQRILAPQGKITLLSVVDVPDFPMYNFYPAPVTMQERDYNATATEMVNQTKMYLEKIAQVLEEQGFVIRIKCEVGEPAAVIVEEAQKCGVEAIVISTHGRSGFSRWLFGSVTQKVLSAMPCPVFVVPGGHLIQEKENNTAKDTAKQ